MNDDIISRSALKKVINEYIEEYSDIDNEGNHCEKWCAMKEAEMAIDNAPPVEPFEPEELKGLRLENEVILRRLKHLLESNYISQFDQVDPNTKEYIRDIKEADCKVAYLCDQNKYCIATVSFDRKQLENIVEERVIEPIKKGELVVKKEKRTTGHWIITNKKYELKDKDNTFVGMYHKCSECGFDEARGGKFCLNCGADMQEEENERKQGI